MWHLKKIEDYAHGLLRENVNYLFPI